LSGELGRPRPGGTGELSNLPRRTAACRTRAAPRRNQEPSGPRPPVIPGAIPQAPRSDGASFRWPPAQAPLQHSATEGPV